MDTLENPIIDKPIIENPIIENAISEKDNHILETSIVEKDNSIIETSIIETSIVENAISENAISEKDIPIIETSIVETSIVENANTIIENANTIIENANSIIENTNPIIETNNTRTPITDHPMIEMVNIKEPDTEPILENQVQAQLQVIVQVPNEDKIIEVNTNKVDPKQLLDQDTLQRLSVGVQLLLELYRVITSSLLILFVPQICNDHICTTTENLVWETNTYNTALCFNFISMAFLVNMYYLELVRENRLIKYLSVNPELANDNDEVSKQLELLSIHRQNKIFTINKYYKLSSYGALTIYSLNVLLSISAISRYYAGSQTLTTFLTYVLFIATKFASVHSIVSTEKNIFYSAYLIGKIQYNGVDEDNKSTK